MFRMNFGYSQLALGVRMRQRRHPSQKGTLPYHTLEVAQVVLLVH